MEWPTFVMAIQLSDTRWVSHDDFMEFGRRLGLPERTISTVIGQMTSQEEAVRWFSEHSFLSDDYKKIFWRDYHFRCSMLKPKT